MNNILRLSIASIIATLLLLTIAPTANIVVAQDNQQTPPEYLLWYAEIGVTNLAMSKDGSLVVAIMQWGFDSIYAPGLYVYDGGGNIIWNYTPENLELYAVKVSDDGNVVVVSFKNNTDSSYRIAYWKNARLSLIHI